MEESNFANRSYQSEVNLHSTGSASCVGIVVGGEDPDKDISQSITITDKSGRNNNSVAHGATENNNKLYSKRMTKRLQHYNREGGTDSKTSFVNDSEESEGVKPCMLMVDIMRTLGRCGGVWWWCEGRVCIVCVIQLGTQMISS